MRDDKAPKRPDELGPIEAPADDSGPIQEGEPARSGARAGCTIAAGIFTVLGVLATLALASCVSFFTTCDANPMALVEREAVFSDAKSQARAYWREKYGEDIDPVEVDYTRYYSGEWGHDDETEVLVNMGGKNTYNRLVLIETDTGRISDNRQAQTIQQALDAYVKDGLAELCEDSDGRLSWATPSSNLEAMPSEYSPLTDEEWEYAQGDGAEVLGYEEGMTREELDAKLKESWEDYLAGAQAEIEPVTFNMEELYASDNELNFPDDTPVTCGMFFTTYYDGDVEAFVEDERASGHLFMDGSDDICVGAAVDDVPTGHGADKPYEWQEDTDAICAWLDEVFDGRPAIDVAPTYYARKGIFEDNALLASYPAVRWTEDEEWMAERRAAQPVFSNWVYLDEAKTIRVDSATGGVVLETDDVLVTRSAAGADQVNQALALIEDEEQLSIEGEVLELRFSDRVHALLGEPSDDNWDDVLDLRLGLDRDDLEITYADAYGSNAMRELNAYLYAWEVADVAADGTVTVADDSDLGWQLSPEATALGNSTPGDWGLHDDSHVILLFVAKRVPLEDAQQDELEA